MPTPPPGLATGWGTGRPVPGGDLLTLYDVALVVVGRRLQGRCGAISSSSHSIATQSQRNEPSTDCVIESTPVTNPP